VNNLNLKIFILGLILSGLIFFFKSVEAAVFFLAGVPLGMASITAYSDFSGAILGLKGRLFLPFVLLGVKFSTLIYLIIKSGPDYTLVLLLIMGAMTFIPGLLFIKGPGDGA